VLTCATLIALLSTDATTFAQWPQWGGPKRDFTVKAEGLAEEWPDDGPRKLWHRELGDGYSSIAVDDGMLYTMYRKTPTDEKEYTVALEANTGATVWEYGVPSPITPDMVRYGPGPHSTPLVAGNRLYTVGANGALHCFVKESGKVRWHHDLLDKYDIDVPEYGYSCSPLAYKDTIILSAVGEDAPRQMLVAFDQTSGHVRWESQSLSRGASEHCEYSSPIIINLDGEDQLIFVTNEQLAGFAPNDGRLLWTHPCPNNGVNVSTPVWNGANVLFFSSAYNSGARAIRLTRKDGTTAPEELWYSRKMRIHHGDAILIGDYVYGSSGDFGRAFFMSMNIETGKRAWVDRRFAKATTIYVNGRLIILDEDGQLALATASPEGLTVHSQHRVTEPISWTAPTLTGTTLYVRDRKHIMALDLG
jgi:hypothetical protein